MSKENIVSSFQFELNKDVRIKSTNELQGFEIYGYHCSSWTDGTNNYISGETKKFTEPLVQLSAIWFKNLYDVVFYKNSDGTEVLSAEKVEYKDNATDPIDEELSNEPKLDGYYFDGWNSALGPILSNTNIIPTFKKYLTLSYKWDGEEGYIEQKKYKKDEIPDPYGIGWIENRQFRTKTGYYKDPDYDFSDGMKESQTFFVTYISNTIDTTISPKDVQYEYGKQYEISVKTQLTPDIQGVTVNHLYKVGEQGQWSSVIPSFSDVGTYIIQISSSYENYYDSVVEREFTIAGEQIWDVTVKYDHYNETERQIYHKKWDTTAVNGHQLADIPSEITSDSNYFKFIGFDKDDWKSVSCNVELSAIKIPNEYTVKFYYDQNSGGELIQTSKTVYNGSVIAPTDIKARDRKTVGGLKYEFIGYWSVLSTGDNRSDDYNKYTTVQQDVNLYAWFKRVYDTKIYKVKEGQRQELSSIEVIDKEYLLSSKIQFPIVDGYYTFEKFNPEPVNGQWQISENTNSISVMYKATQGTLTYHSNFPE